MAYVIGDFGTINRNIYLRMQTLSCMKNETKKFKMSYLMPNVFKEE